MFQSTELVTLSLSMKFRHILRNFLDEISTKTRGMVAIIYFLLSQYLISLGIDHTLHI
jgi:hypothetical protein